MRILEPAFQLLAPSMSTPCILSFKILIWSTLSFKKPDLGRSTAPAFDSGTKLHNPWIVTLSFALYTECSHYLPPTASPNLPSSASVAARRSIAAVVALRRQWRRHCGAAAEMERRHIFFWHDHDRSHISQTRRLELLFLEAMPSLSFSTELICADASNRLHGCWC